MANSATVRLPAPLRGNTLSSNTVARMAHADVQACRMQNPPRIQVHPSSLHHHSRHRAACASQSSVDRLCGGAVERVGHVSEHRLRHDDTREALRHGPRDLPAPRRVQHHLFG